MKCKKCGMTLREGLRFCPNCGTPCAVVQNYAPAPVPTKKSDKAKYALIGVIAVFAVIVILGMMFRNTDSNPEMEDTREPTANSVETSKTEPSTFNNFLPSSAQPNTTRASEQRPQTRTAPQKPKIPKYTFTQAPGSDFWFGETNRFSAYKGRWEIEGYHGNGDYIRLPTTYDGDGVFGEKNVTVIGGDAFNGDNIRGVSVPDGYVYLNMNSFRNCPSLETVEFEGSVQEIDAAFIDCPALKWVILPYGVTKMKSNTFTNCTSLEYVELPDTITRIEDYAIEKCGDNVIVYIPPSVTSISETAFRDNVTIIAEPGSYAAQYDEARQAQIESKKHTTAAAYTPTGNTQVTYPDYSTAKLPCPTCKGAKKVQCRVCGGDGVVLERTRGTGSNTWTETVRCNNCQNGKMQCPTCFGTGTIQ